MGLLVNGNKYNNMWLNGEMIDIYHEYAWPRWVIHITSSSVKAYRLYVSGRIQLVDSISNSYSVSDSISRRFHWRQLARSGYDQCYATTAHNKFVIYNSSNSRVVIRLFDTNSEAFDTSYLQVIEGYSLVRMSDGGSAWLYNYSTTKYVLGYLSDEGVFTVFDEPSLTTSGMIAKNGSTTMVGTDVYDLSSISSGIINKAFSFTDINTSVTTLYISDNGRFVIKYLCMYDKTTGNYVSNSATGAPVLGNQVDINSDNEDYIVGLSNSGYPAAWNGENFVHYSNIRGQFYLQHYNTSVYSAYLERCFRITMNGLETGYRASRMPSNNQHILIANPFNDNFVNLTWVYPTRIYDHSQFINTMAYSAMVSPTHYLRGDYLNQLYSLSVDSKDPTLLLFGAMTCLSAEDNLVFPENLIKLQGYTDI